MKWRPEVPGQGHRGRGVSVSTLRGFVFFQTPAVGVWFVRLSWSVLYMVTCGTSEMMTPFCFVRDNSTALSRDPTVLRCLVTRDCNSLCRVECDHLFM